jgi:intraflagellar transport protein 56
MKKHEAATSQEYILKAVTLTLHGQRHDAHQDLKEAQQYFQLVGSSPAECDTIPGRQCMVSALFLRKKFDEALVYLNSIKVNMANQTMYSQLLI